MRIGYDATVLLGPRTGIGYYTDFLIRYLQDDPRLSLFEYNGLSMRPLLPSEERKDSSTGGVRPIIVEMAKRLPGGRSIYRRLKKVNFVKAAKQLDLFHATNYLPPAETQMLILPLIHDVSHIRHPQWHPAERVRWLEAGARQLLAAPLINTVSSFSAREITATLGIPPSRLRITSPGTNPLYRTDPKDADASLARLGLQPGNFFLCVGALEPRKNLTTALRAYMALPRPMQRRAPLLIVGPKGWGNLDLPSGIDKLEREGQIRFIGYQPEKIMHVLYHEAAAFLFPSSYEGFGMPVSEAMATGTRPVVAAGGAPEEVSGGFGLALPPFDHMAWRDAMIQAMDEHWQRDASLRTKLQRASAGFDWAINARSTLSIYEELILLG
jgi:glycosyltransferase involved in cell wall biosynthesis